MNSTESKYDERTATAVAKMRAEIESGEKATLAARVTEANEHITGHPDWQVRSEDYARIVVVLGRYAGSGNRAADDAAAILAKISPNLGERQMMKQIARAIATLAHSDWDDVRYRTGPESVRYSDALRPPTAEYRLGLAILWEEINSKPTTSTAVREAQIGWVMHALLQDVNVPVWAPLVRKAIEQ